MKFYLDNEKNIDNLFKGLSQGLRTLDFPSNFNGKEVSFQIAPATGSAPNLVPGSITIQNPLTYIPSRYIIVSQDNAGILAWNPQAQTQKQLTFLNYGSQTTNFIVFLLKQ
jgi:hypothetical protein